jgi:hypothetical protein
VPTDGVAWTAVFRHLQRLTIHLFQRIFGRCRDGSKSAAEVLEANSVGRKKKKKYIYMKFIEKLRLGRLALACCRRIHLRTYTFAGHSIPSGAYMTSLDSPGKPSISLSEVHFKPT